ncbi:hypothetical protein JL720_10714 [Aureococcus anophagefferens]|nr:hypothetical protein JL720_10714 [Aureococcus anophagefferens]
MSCVVCGTTGAGKSTLLNALLGESEVLPTNGMRACTAVLIELRYLDDAASPGDGSTYVGEAEFLTRAEWDKEEEALFEELTTQDGRAILNRFMDSSNLLSDGACWPIVKKVRAYGRWPVLKSGAVLADALARTTRLRGAVVKLALKEADSVWIVSNINRAVNDRSAKDLLGESFKRTLLMDGATPPHLRRDAVGRHGPRRGDAPERAELEAQFTMPVYCVSSVDYQKLKGVRGDDGPPQVYDAASLSGDGDPGAADFAHAASLSLRAQGRAPDAVPARVRREPRVGRRGEARHGRGAGRARPASATLGAPACPRRSTPRSGLRQIRLRVLEADVLPRLDAGAADAAKTRRDGEQAAMQPGYDRGFVEKGTGSHRRRCAVVESHVTKEARSMFKGAIAPVVARAARTRGFGGSRPNVVAGLAKLRADVGKILKDTRAQALDDLRLNYSVLWEPGAAPEARGDDDDDGDIVDITSKVAAERTVEVIDVDDLDVPDAPPAPPAAASARGGVKAERA